MGKHKLMTSSEQMFFTPFKRNKDSNPVGSAGGRTVGDRLYPQDQFDNNRVNCINSTQTTAPRSCVFPANYTLHVGKLTSKAVQKGNGLTLSPSCLYPSKKHDTKDEIPVNSHSFNTERQKDDKMVRRKALCRREFTTPRQKQSGRLSNGSKTSKSKQVSQSPGAKSLLVLIEKTMKEISDLRKRQQTLCYNQQPCCIKDNCNDRPRFQGFQETPNQRTSAASESRADDTEE